MKKSIILEMLPTEIWLKIYKIEFYMLFNLVLEEMKAKVVFIEIDKSKQTFFVCSSENQFSQLAVF